MANLTPSDVRNVAFNKPPLGRRGYDEDEVDSFLDNIEQTLTYLYRQLEQLRTAAAQRPASAPGQAAPVPETQSPPFASVLSGPFAGTTEQTRPSELDLIKQRLDRIERALDERGY